MNNLLSRANLTGYSRLIIFLLSFLIIFLIILIFIAPGNVKQPVNLNKPVVNKLANLKKLDINKPEVVKQNLKQLSVLTPEGREAVVKGFDRDLQITATESGDIKKSSPYVGLYSGLRARYNVTKDPDVLRQMRGIEELIKKEWPRIYKSLEEGGTFLR